MNTENRKKENTGLMESLELRTVRGRDREREREKKHSKNYIPKTLTQCFIHVCVQCTLLYKSFGGMTEVLSYFNALKERLH